MSRFRPGVPSRRLRGRESISIATLNWRPGREAASHKVYFGKDMAAVTDGTAPVQTVADHRFTPGAMEYGQTYYWRVDEVNEAKVSGTV